VIVDGSSEAVKVIDETPGTSSTGTGVKSEGIGECENA
jgi:hypothetical protein